MVKKKHNRLHHVLGGFSSQQRNLAIVAFISCWSLFRQLQVNVGPYPAKSKIIYGQTLIDQTLNAGPK